MPDEENKLVDIDTSGPDTEIELEETQTEETELPEVETPTEDKAEDKTFENERETKLEEKKETQVDKDKELEQYSDGVQKRISKLTKKWREAERQKDEALNFAQAQIKAKQAAEQKISKFEPEYFKNAEDSINNGLEAAKAKLSAARDANNLSAEAEALAAISELGFKKAKFNETKTAQEEWNKNREKEVKQPEINLNRQRAAQGTPDPKAETWATRNAWFGQDTAMTYTAFDLHKKLTEQEGYDPSSDEYYLEIDKRIRLEFPHKFGKVENQTSKPTQNVASATRSSKTGRKSVKLTSSQVAIAKKLGVPLEEYAKQLITKEV